MTKEYELLPDGGVRLFLPSGLSVRSALTPGQLEKVGYAPRVAPPEGRLAFGDTPRDDGSGGAGNVPETRSDVGPMYGQGGAPGVGSGGGTEGQAGTETPEPGTPPLAAPPKEQSQTVAVPERQRIQVPDDAASVAGAAVGGAPRRTIVLPGGFPRVSAQVQRGTPASMLPGKAERAANAERVDNADIGAAAADITGLAQQHAALAGAAQLQARAENEIEKRRRGMFEDLSRRRQQLMTQMAELESTAPDPKRFYRQMGSVGQVTAFLGALFGGIRAGLQGGENQFLARMDKLHDREIQEQIELRGLKERGIKVRSTELDKLTDLMQGDQDAAAKLLRVQYGIVGDQLLRDAAKNTGDLQIRAKLEQMLAARQQERQFETANIWQAHGDKTVEKFERVAPQVIQTGGSSPRTKRQLDFANELQGLEVRARNKIGYLRGKVDSTTQRFRQNQINDYETFIDELGELRALAVEAEKSGNPQMISQARSKIDALHNKLGAQENVLKGQGAMSDREYEAAMRGLGNLQSLFSKDTIGGEGLARIDENRASWDRNFRKFMENTVIEAPQDGRALWEDDAWFYDFQNRRPFQLPDWAGTAERREPN